MTLKVLSSRTAVRLWTVLALVLLLGAPAVQAQTAVLPSGTGTLADPYQITELGNLVWMGINVVSEGVAGKSYKLMNDIDASDTANWNDSGTDGSVLEGFKPIGNSSSSSYYFRASVDGNGKTITGLTINRPTTDAVGLFGYMDSGGSVSNLTLVGVTVTGNSYVDGMVGVNYGPITNCGAIGAVTGLGDRVGGLIGGNWGTITNCYATGAVTGTSYVGCLIGDNSGTITNCGATGAVTGTSYVGCLIGDNSGTITNCNATGAVTGTSYVGGLIGENDGTIANCYATGVVTGTYYGVGGLVGNSNGGPITNCYATGAVSGSSDCVGGLIGQNGGTTVTNCYATGSVSGNAYVGGLIGSGSYGTITTCYATGAVAGSNSYVGGLFGINSNCTIATSYATGVVTGTQAVGGLVGCSNDGPITNCYATGAVSGSSDCVGGLIGDNGGPVTNCYATGSVSGNAGVGGLIGSGRYGTITTCYATGAVAGSNCYVGGLFGRNSNCTIATSYATGGVTGLSDYVGGLIGDNGGPIENCFATGVVSGDDYVGGLIGDNGYYGTITDCYATGRVTGTTPQVGGLIGFTASGAPTSSYWDTQTSGQPGSAGGFGRTTAQMKQQATFVGWDFAIVWTILENVTYPTLHPPPDFGFSSQRITSSHTETWNRATGSVVSRDRYSFAATAKMPTMLDLATVTDETTLIVRVGDIRFEKRLGQASKKILKGVNGGSATFTQQLTDAKDVLRTVQTVKFSWTKQRVLKVTVTGTPLPGNGPVSGNFADLTAQDDGEVYWHIPRFVGFGHDGAGLTDGFASLGETCTGRKITKPVSGTDVELVSWNMSGR